MKFFVDKNLFTLYNALRFLKFRLSSSEKERGTSFAKVGGSIPSSTANDCREGAGS